VSCFVGRNEARFSRQEDFGTSRIEAEPDNGLGESGLGEGQELLGRAEEDRLVAGKTPETRSRQLGVLRVAARQQTAPRVKSRTSGASTVGTSSRPVAAKRGSAYELELAQEPHFLHAHRLDGCQHGLSRSVDLDRVLRARVKARHELLKQGYTTTVISRPLPYTCASFIFAHAATPTVYC
jgi:hypothetical protein